MGRSLSGEAGRMAGEVQQPGAVRCTICGHGIAKRIDLILKGDHVMHAACDAKTAVPTREQEAAT